LKTDWEPALSNTLCKQIKPLSVVMYISKRSGMDHTVSSANTPYLPFLRKRSPDGATLNSGKRHSIAAYYSSIDPEGINGWIGLVCWHIADGLPVYPHKWSPISYRSSAGLGKFAGQRVTFNRCATQSTVTLSLSSAEIDDQDNNYRFGAHSDLTILTTSTFCNISD